MLLCVFGSFGGGSVGGALEPHSQNHGTLGTPQVCTCSRAQDWWSIRTGRDREEGSTHLRQWTLGDREWKRLPAGIIEVKLSLQLLISSVAAFKTSSSCLVAPSLDHHANDRA